MEREENEKNEGEKISRVSVEITEGEILNSLKRKERKFLIFPKSEREKRKN